MDYDTVQVIFVVMLLYPFWPILFPIAAIYVALDAVIRWMKQ